MPVEILVVDDEPDLELLIRQKFRKKIRSNEWAFHFAQNGFEALDVLDSNPGVSLVMTDINMPGMDGLTLLDRLSHRSEIFKSIVISAYGDLSNIRTAMNRGAFDFVTKPVDFDDLEITIAKTLREVRAFKEAMKSRQALFSIQRELAVAARIQEALIRDKELQTENVDIYALLEPAQEVGGDFYDFFKLDKKRIGVVIGDVSGKGVSAALFMAITKTLLRAIAMDGRPTADCLTYVNALLHPQSLPEMFVTCCYGILNTDTGEFEYTTAGHFPPFVIRSNGDITQPALTRSVGLCMLQNFKYKQATVMLYPGDSIFLYTDGLDEATRNDGEQFTLQRIKTALAETVTTTSSERIDKVVAEVKAFTHEAPQSDDLTLLSLRYTG